MEVPTKGLPQKANEKEDNTDPSRLNWGLLFILSTGYLAVSLNLVGFQAMFPFIQEEFSLTLAQVGFYSTFFFTSATFVALLSGRVVDLLGTKRGLLIGVGSMGVFMFLHALAPLFIFILALAFLSGIGFSIITPAVNKGVMEGVLPRHRAVSMGIMQSGGGVGGFIGASLLPALAVAIGWRYSIIIISILALTLIPIIYFFYQDSSHKKRNVKDIKGKKSPLQSKETAFRDLGFRDSFQVILKNRPLLVVCGIGLIFGLNFGAVSSHFTLFLTHDLAISRALIGLGLGTIQIGGLLGRPGWGWISDRFFHGNRRRSLFALALFSGLIMLIFGLFINTPSTPLSLVFFLSFILGSGVMAWTGLYFTSISELAGREYTGTATGLALIVTRLGIMMGPLFFGYIADVSGTYNLSWILFSLIGFIISFAFYYISGQEETRVFMADLH